MKKCLLLMLVILISVNLQAQIAPTYYDGIDFNQKDEALKVQLTDLITKTDINVVFYSDLWEILKVTDQNPDNNNNVLLLYGWDNTNAEDDDDYDRNKSYTCGNGNSCTDFTWNREHVFPKSLDTSGSDNEGPTADPHMLRASDVEMNSLRANRPFGEGTGIASYVTNTGAFYPGENWKGDVARIIMYMYVRYGEQWNPTLVGTGATTYHNAMPDIFLQWNAEDPVSTYEVQRNDYVAQVQGNRNPFIDNPYLATMIWGGPKAENMWQGTLSTNTIQSHEIKIYPNPTQDYITIQGVSKDAHVQIVNVLGQNIEVNQNTKILLPQNGVYFIKIQQDGEVYTYKVIKK